MRPLVNLTQPLGNKIDLEKREELVWWRCYFTSNKFRLKHQKQQTPFSSAYWVVSASPDSTCPGMTCSDMTCSNLTCPDITYPDLTWPDLTWPALTWHVLTRSVPRYPVKTLLKNYCDPEIFEGPKILNFCRTKIGVEFCQGSIGTIRSSLATSYDVWQHRATLGEGCSCCSSLVVLVTGENKVNSYSDQLKLGWVCKFGVEFDN